MERNNTSIEAKHTNEEEEDYMSEKFLKELEKQQAEESGRSKVSRKRKQPEQPKPQRVVQKETLEKGLATPIPESNIGFKLLASMGYKKGTSLGKTNTGLVEPLAVKIREGRVGLGVLEEKEQAEVFTQVKRQRIETTFKERRRSAFDDRKLQKQLTECINISQQLDEAKNIPLENNTILKEYDAHKVNEDGEEIKIGGWVRSLTIDDKEEKLATILHYLRSEHLYCYFCGTQYDSIEDVVSNCPGPLEDQH
jgi:hypothetical protein